MKDVITFRVLIGVLAFVILGCGSESEDREITVAQFLSADPPSGSLLSPEATITVSFDGAPIGISVIPNEFKSGFSVRQGGVSGDTVTISGNFSLGELTLVMKWQNEEHTLVYTVQDEVVLIPGSDFQMGSDVNADEKPIHTVFVDSFYMDINEVTVAAYRQFVHQTGHPPPDWNQVSNYSPTDEHPIVLVSWHDAMTYAKWVGKRLPTEAEWEKAARGGMIQQVYPWGEMTPDGIQCNFADKHLTLYWWADPQADDGYTYTAPIRSYPQNEYGLYDMAGNVWEWCLDEYDAGFYAVSSDTNPIAGIDTIEGISDVFPSVSSARVVRGGSWLVTAMNCRNAVRFRLAPISKSASVGFRCVMDLEILE